MIRIGCERVDYSSTFFQRASCRQYADYASYQEYGPENYGTHVSPSKKGLLALASLDEFEAYTPHPDKSMGRMKIPWSRRCTGQLWHKPVGPSAALSLITRQTGTRKPVAHRSTHSNRGSRIPINTAMYVYPAR